MIRRAAMVTAAAFALTALSFVATGRLSGPYRIDEAHKVADTYFFTLLLRGDLANPDWLRHIVDRTNPPVGKFVFGAAATAQGTSLVDDLGVRVEDEGGRLGQSLTGNNPERYRPTLLAMRRASLAATALAAAAVCLGAILATSSATAGAIAALLFSTSFLALTHGASAVYDPLLTCFVALSALPALAFWKSAKRPWLWGSLAGLACALAAQTRLTGFLSILPVLAVASATIVRGRKREGAIFAGAALALTFAAATILNPYYWTSDGLAVIPQRYAAQLQDLETLRAHEAGSQTVLRGPWDRIAFASEYLFADLSGIALAAGIALGVLFLLPSLNTSGRRIDLTGVFLWSVTATIAFAAAMPFAWSRHLLPVVPALALLAGAGWGELAARLRTRRT